jgi:catechol 2,3-dioxygenase
MQAKSLGHIVLKIRDLEPAVHFYRDVLGLKEVGRYQGRMVFFSFGQNHHDLALLEVGPNAPAPNPNAVGMYHFALKVGNSLAELREMKRWLEQNQVRIVGMSDHKVSQALYITDPDGNEIELYVDSDPEIWHKNPSAVATVQPLEL